MIPPRHLHRSRGFFCPRRDTPVYDLRFTIYDLRFTIYDLGFGIWDLGFGIWDLGFGIWDASALRAFLLSQSEAEFPGAREQRRLSCFIETYVVAQREEVRFSFHSSFPCQSL